LTGGVVTKGTGATVSITAMDGMIFTGSTLGTSPLIYFKKAAQTSITPTGLTDGAVNWIYMDYDGGGLTYKATTTRSTIDEYTMFTVARVWVSGAEVEVQASGHSLYNKDRRAHNRLILKYSGMDHVSGGTVSALTVGGASGQGVQTDNGSWYIANTPFTTLAKVVFKVWYKTGGVWTESASINTFDDDFAGAGVTVFTRYQNGDDLGTLSGSKYGVYWIFLCPEGDIYVVLGIGDYANIGLAQAATVPLSLPPYLVDWGRLIGRVICQKSSATHYSVESSFSTQFTLSAAVDHSSLADLAADDHTQYILVAGTRAFTGAQSMGSQRLTTLAAPTTNGDAVRATTKITEVNLESAVDLKHAVVTVSLPVTITDQAIKLDDIKASESVTIAANKEYISLDDLYMAGSVSLGDGAEAYITNREGISDVIYHKIEWYGGAVHWKVLADETITVRSRMQYLVSEIFDLAGSISLGDESALIVRV
jgi:hypothetical protein